MWLNPQETADLVTSTEEIFNGKLHFLRSACSGFLVFVTNNWHNKNQVQFFRESLSIDFPFTAFLGLRCFSSFLV